MIDVSRWVTDWEPIRSSAGSCTWSAKPVLLTIRTLSQFLLRAYIRRSVAAHYAGVHRPFRCVPDLLCSKTCVPSSVKTHKHSCRTSKHADVWKWPKWTAVHGTCGLICARRPSHVPSKSDHLWGLWHAWYDERHSCLQRGLLPGCFGTAAASELTSSACSVNHGWHAPTVTADGAGVSCLTVAGQHFNR